MMLLAETYERGTSRMTSRLLVIQVTSLALFWILEFLGLKITLKNDQKISTGLDAIRGTYNVMCLSCS